MENYIINKKLLGLLIVFLVLPLLVTVILAFYYNDGINFSFSLNGFRELLTEVRLSELLEIAKRALFVSLVSTVIAFLVSYILVTCTSQKFQLFFLIAIILPFLITESVRVFSWQYLLSENGTLNRLLSFVSNRNLIIFNSSNNWNIYLVMLISCIPFGIFICSASLKTTPAIYFQVAADLNLSPFYKMYKVGIPLSKFALTISLIVIFFMAFALSTEVNYLGGDTKLSTRNFVLSLMSASKFLAVFSLGCAILFALFITLFSFTYSNKKKVSA